MTIDFSIAVPSEVLARIQQGVMRTKYRGIPLYKSPFDLSLYMQLLGRLRPRTIIEIGTKAGGSALWFADMLTIHGLESRVVSVDILSKPEVQDDRIVFLQGDALDLGKALPPALLDELTHPWLVVEDSAHFYNTTMAALRFFHSHLKAGDYIVVEDGVVASLPGDHYRQYEDGPNRAVQEFVGEQPDGYVIDRELCDFYGQNVTYNPSGWLRRT